MSQDALVKMWVMSEPDLRSATRSDGRGSTGVKRGLGDNGIIFFDEAQDINPVLAQVVNGQQAQLVTVGDGNQSIYCQVLGTGVTVVRGSGRSAERVRIPIEDVREGDRVLAYSTEQAHLYRDGCTVTAVTRFRHTGDVVRIKTETGLTSAYTPKHHMVVRMAESMRTSTAVYLMRKGDQYRVGSCRLFYSGAGQQNGIRMRMQQERADAAWLLSVHDDEQGARLQELLVQQRFNLPSVRFDGAVGQDSMVLRDFWAQVDDTAQAASACLAHFGRLMEFPLLSHGSAGSAGSRRSFATAAANFIEGMEVLPEDADFARNGKAPRSSWVAATRVLEPYDDDVVSLTVDKAHTYFGDGILTHNSFRGATNQLDEMRADYDLPLDVSWRFGAGVAEAGNRMLRLAGSKDRVVGGGPDSEILQPNTMKDPEGFLARTNAGALAAALEMIGEGRVTGVSEKQRAKFESIQRQHPSG